MKIKIGWVKNFEIVNKYGKHLQIDVKQNIYNVWGVDI